MDLTPFANKRVTVVVPDATRPIDPAVIDRLIAELRRQRAEITILVALGLHRPMTDAELEPLLSIATRHRALLLQHDAHDPDLIAVGEARFHPAVVQAEALIAVGLVEPHQYAGFSGGVKTIAIGCAGAATIAHLHGLRFLRQRGTRIGCIDGNPFQEELWRLASPFAIWALQIVPGGDTHFGPVRDAFAHAVAQAATLCFFDVDEELDWMHLVVPRAKAQSFYQASRAATYVALVDRPAIKQGGMLIVDAPCPEGLGVGSGEQAFVRALARGRDVLLDELIHSDRAISGGEQRAYVLALATERARIGVLGAPSMPELAPLGVVELAELGALPGRGRRFDDPFQRVPRLGGSS